jgi:hypothetical protein
MLVAFAQADALVLQGIGQPSIPGSNATVTRGPKEDRHLAAQS